MSIQDIDVSKTKEAVALSDRVYWVGALDPTLRNFDIILITTNGTTYNPYLVRGSNGVAVIDTVKEQFSNRYFTRLESVADYNEIKIIVLNHLEPDHSGALPELMKRAPQARLYISQKAQIMLKALLKRDEPDCQTVGVRIKLIPTDDELSACRQFGQNVASALQGELESKVFSLEQVLQTEQDNARSF